MQDMKTWFETENQQIIDLNNFSSFWVEETDTGYKVVGEDTRNEDMGENT